MNNICAILVLKEEAQVSRLRGALGSTDIPSAAESYHVGGGAASEVWSLGLDCGQTEIKIIAGLIVSDTLTIGFATFFFFFLFFCEKKKNPTLVTLFPFKVL